MLKLSALVALGAGMVVAGCKSAPELTKDQAQSLIQAKYDQSAPVSAPINVSDLGVHEGLTAKYWAGSKIYPNKFWGDFSLTPEGKKVVKLDKGDVIEWRPESLTDKKFNTTVYTVAQNHLKAKGIKDVQDEGDGTKGVDFDESYDLTGVPDALQGIAHNPGNKLANKRHAVFSYADGAWKLVSIK